MTEDSTEAQRPDRSALRKQGKDLRSKVQRGEHGGWAPPPDRQDPIHILGAQDLGRVRSLVPIKYGRMMESPFSFLRGSAAVMTADLAATPTTGLNAQLCGDAHLSNFGLFATPERKLVFDINDFDETYPGPWEWDLKRLAASVVVAGRDVGLSDADCRELAIEVSEIYRGAMDRLADALTLDVWYYQVAADDVGDLFDRVSSKRGKRQADKAVRKARTRTQERSLGKMTSVVDGRRKLVNDPPLVVRFAHLVDYHHLDQEWTISQIEDAWRQYLASLSDDRRRLLASYSPTDMAIRVGGVGSVGTRCCVALVTALDDDDAMILQYKEAGPSVLQSALPRHHFNCHAERVVLGQRLMQASSDIFLGWHTAAHSGTDFYWRQLKDMKGSFDVSAFDKAGLKTYVAVCALCLARAHARTGAAAAIRGYLGKGSVFDEAIGTFSMTYADQNESDYEKLLDAVRSGAVEAEPGV